MAVSSRLCHYCERGAPEVFMTRDHIVPRYRVRALRLPGGHPFFGMNLVPACGPCNQLKGYFARMCSCPKCIKAWDVFLILRGAAQAA
jgi:hypothetical protein